MNEQMKISKLFHNFKKIGISKWVNEWMSFLINFKRIRSSKWMDD
jgi:hypothetical protein